MQDMTVTPAMQYIFVGLIAVLIAMVGYYLKGLHRTFKKIEGFVAQQVIRNEYNSKEHKENLNEHKEIWGNIEEHSEKLASHEKRISILEI